MISLKDPWLGNGARECFICKEKGSEVKIARRIFSFVTSWGFRLLLYLIYLAIAISHCGTTYTCIIVSIALALPEFFNSI